MLDIFNIPGQQDNVKIFYASDANAWQTWTKPRNCKFIWMMCIGGASGGAGGVSGSASTSPGLSGGGSGAITRALFPANTLPDTLYVQPGPGGIGGPGVTSTSQIGNTPGAGNRSFVSITPSSAVTMNLVCTSGALAATTAGAGETALITPSTTAGLLSLGVFTSTAGSASSPSNITPLTTILLTGGGGHPGGGTNALGASILSVNLGTFSTPQISAGTQNTGQPGASGVWNWKLMYGTGGACGGSNNAGIGGNGGDGAYGCGGGAGAPGTNAAGGNGGKGGDGLVIIATF